MVWVGAGEYCAKLYTLEGKSTKKFRSDAGEEI